MSFDRCNCPADRVNRTDAVLASPKPDTKEWLMRSNGFIRKFGAVVVGAGVIVGGGALSAPSASADTVAPAFGVPQGVDMGQVTISTAPGGFIDVRVSGRGDAVNTYGPAGNGCFVSMGSNVYTTFIELDPFGNGVARFGPYVNGDYAISGICGSRDISARKPLISTDDRKNAVGVTIDGNPTSVTGGAPSVIGAIPAWWEGNIFTDYRECGALAQGLVDSSKTVPDLPGVRQVSDLIIGGLSAAVSTSCAGLAGLTEDAQAAAQNYCNAFSTAWGQTAGLSQFPAPKLFAQCS
ncbi:hypothetical protein [Rhodococcus sp. 114MFTsu3.1]|uniref:hypothetical protein n=1 Tax=Rhodococcus sp. 114MFTsu3.1 TaxID=1172184 RepID=UPI0018CABC90|nr:hypothetical protein [Rhodococcus sp. 114MFTsu3.1]